MFCCYSNSCSLSAALDAIGRLKSGWNFDAPYVSDSSRFMCYQWLAEVSGKRVSNDLDETATVSEKISSRADDNDCSARQRFSRRLKGGKHVNSTKDTRSV